MTTKAETSDDRTGTPPRNRRAPRGQVVIDQNRCKGCGYCVAFCPTGVLGLSQGFNCKGYHYPEVLRPEDCAGCDLCGMYCPDFAIYAVRLAKKDQKSK